MMKRCVFALVVLLAAVAVGVCAAPASAPAPAAPAAQWTASGHPDYQPDPAAAAGETELVVEVKDSDGKPLTSAKVLVTADMAAHSMGAMQGEATDQGNGRYATKVPFGMAGDWKITVEVRQGDTVLATPGFRHSRSVSSAMPTAASPARSGQIVWLCSKSDVGAGLAPALGGCMVRQKGRCKTRPYIRVQLVTKAGARPAPTSGSKGEVCRDLAVGRCFGAGNRAGSAAALVCRSRAEVGDASCSPCAVDARLPQLRQQHCRRLGLLPVLCPRPGWGRKRQPEQRAESAGG